MGPRHPLRKRLGTHAERSSQQGEGPGHQGDHGHGFNSLAIFRREPWLLLFPGRARPELDVRSAYAS